MDIIVKYGLKSFIRGMPMSWRQNRSNDITEFSHNKIVHYEIFTNASACLNKQLHFMFTCYVLIVVYLFNSDIKAYKVEHNYVYYMMFHNVCTLDRSKCISLLIHTLLLLCPFKMNTLESFLQDFEIHCSLPLAFPPCCTVAWGVSSYILIS